MDKKLKSIRHSLAHVLAQAVLQIRPRAKLAFGPAIETGFYYDFDFDEEEPLIPADLKDLEKRMKRIIRAKQTFECEKMSYEALQEKLKSSGQLYKLEYAEDLKKQGETNWTLYWNEQFWDMCRGGHVEHTGEIPLDAFSLDSLAGAYWRGSEKNKMLQRVYGLAFETGEELIQFKRNRQLAMQRDHRKLNKTMQFFVIDEVAGKGLPMWAPNGAVIREEIEKLAKEKEFLAGYKRVVTPEITKEELYLLSGHLPYYADSMFPPMKTEEGETFYLTPMNCPHHHLLFKSQPRSYRDLPVRFAEYGRCYRYEKSGELAGLLRVRGMTMNDAHIYCTPEQTKQEFIDVINMHIDYYKIFGLSDFWMRLSLSEEGSQKYVDQPELWKQAENVVMEAMEECGLPYQSERGEAAFYGPKIDFQVRNVVGREETASTNQLDLIMSKRFDLSYIGEDGRPHHPFIIHRAPLGTHERFCSFLIEHYGGAFPTWLAPVQVLVIPVAQPFHDYAFTLKKTLVSKLIRIEVDDSSDSLSKKIRNGAMSKAPNLLIVGEEEQKLQKVSWKRYRSKDQKLVSIDYFLEQIQQEITDRREVLPAF